MRTAVAAFLVAGALGLVGCQAASGEAFQYTFNQPVPLGDGETVGQTFRPVTDAVAGVDVLTATYGGGVDAGGELRAVLRDGVGGPALARGSVPGAELGDNEWATIRFPEPARAPEVAALELDWRGDGSVAVWVNAPLEDVGEDDLLNDPYEGGELLRGGEPAVGDLAFRVVGTGGPADAARNLASIARRGAGRLGSDPLFALAWLALLGGAVWLGWRGLRRPSGQLGDGRRHEQRREYDEARP